MTVAVNFLIAHSSSQGVGRLQQAMIGMLGYAAWMPECIKDAATGV